MKKVIIMSVFLIFGLFVFGQYGYRSKSEPGLSEITSVLTGIIALITIIVVWVISARLMKIIKNQKQLIKVQTISAISTGIVEGRTCVKCGDIHSPDLLLEKDICPKCKISYKKSRVILKHYGIIDSYSRDYYEQHKNECELLWEHKQ